MSIEKSVEKGEKKVGSEKQGVEKKKREESEEGRKEKEESWHFIIKTQFGIYLFHFIRTNYLKYPNNNSNPSHIAAGKWL